MFAAAHGPTRAFQLKPCSGELLQKGVEAELPDAAPGPSGTWLKGTMFIGSAQPSDGFSPAAVCKLSLQCWESARDRGNDQHFCDRRSPCTCEGEVEEREGEGRNWR